MTTLIQAISDATAGAGAAVAQFFNELPPEGMDKVQALLQKGYCLGVQTVFADTGVEVAILAVHPEFGAIPLQRATVPASLLTTTAH